MTQNFKEFLEYYKEMERYNRTLAIISWELHTSAPKKSVDSLVELVSYYGGKAFEMSVSDKMGEYLERLSQKDEYEKLEDEWKKGIDKLKEEYDENKNIPVEFYNEYLETVAKSEDVWQYAKRDNDYESFKPYLEKLIDMTKSMCKYRNPKKSPYDLLLNDFEKGMESKEIDVVFNELKEELVPFLKKILEKEQPDSSKFIGKFDINKQKELSRFLLEYIGFDMDAGMMAESEHPFTSEITRTDVRLTNHYDEANIINPMFSIIHEGGHGIFEQNKHEKYDDTPFAHCNSMGLHESQSRFFENILGRNINFWKPIYGKIQEMFPEYKEISLEEFYREINHVSQGFIRVDSDEVSYCFHIIVRYEVERMLFGGEITFDELPKVWNEKMKEYLGIVPDTYSKGLLQDSHWSGGMFGYFPSYLLGSVYDGMIYEKLKKDLGDIDEILADGRIKEITKWLNENIHRDGSAKNPTKLIEELCGEKVTAKPLIRFFKEKYSSIYGIEE